MNLAHDVHGPANGRIVALLHGLSSCRGGYGSTARRLASKGFRVVAIDLRGHGDSPKVSLNEYNADAYAVDVIALLERLGAKKDVVIAGHSLGGVVAAHIARLRPDLVAAVFLEDPPLFEGDKARREASPAAKFFPYIVKTVRSLQSQNAPASAYAKLAGPDATEEEASTRCVGLTKWDPTAMEAALAGILWKGYDPSIKLHCPVTVLAADPAVGPVFTPGDGELFKKTNPHARIVTVKKTGHTIRGGKNGEAKYAEELDAFLDSVGGSKARL